MNKYNESLDNLVDALDSLPVSCYDEKDVELLQELIDKQEKYRWHDLRKNPNDLPKRINGDKRFLVMYESGFISTVPYNEGWNCVLMPNGTIYKKTEITKVIKWKEIEKE